jgi:hypothetical protein
MRVWGANTIGDWDSSKAHVLRLVELHGVPQLLVDVRHGETAPSILEMFEFGALWPHHIRTAVLLGQKNREQHQFLETVALNRAKQLRVFDDERQALAWLRRPPRSIRADT